MRVHPVAELFRLLDGDELAELVADIDRNGLRHPITVDRNGVLLDGRNRLAACEVLGLVAPTETYIGGDPLGFIISENLKRRHLDAGQRAMLAVALLPHIEAQAQRGRPKKGGKAATITGEKSRELAARATGASARNVSHAKAIKAELPEVAAEVEAGQRTIADGASELRKRRAKAKHEARQAEWDAAANRAGAQVDVRLGDFREVLADIEPGTVDAIVTDPPYPDEFLPMWSDVAAFAAKVLRPGAPLIAWSGQYRLPEVLVRITEHLDYRWTVCLDLPGENSRFRATHMIQSWKPIVIATAGAWGPHPWHIDRVVSPKKDQDLYEWQQHPDPAAELIERYVPEGGLVVDPFAGVGSFGIAAVTTGRRFIGAELDEDRHRTAAGRIAEVGQ